MRVLIADKLAPLAAQLLRDAGHDVFEEPAASGAALVLALKRCGAEVLVVRSTRVGATHLEASASLALVVRAGAGVNTIDLDAAGAQGVFVSNCPGRNAIAVAELTMGLLLSIDRRIPDNVISARAGRWAKGEFSKAQGLAGRRLGLLGMGRIGCAVAQRARAFGLSVTAWSRSLTPEAADELGVRWAPDPVHVARHSDILSVHLALADATRGLVSAEVLGALPEGAVVLNTSRAEVVDEAALLEGLDHRGLRAGLDVFAGEPSGKMGELNSPLASHERVYLTHHIGASTEEAQRSVASEVAHIVVAYGHAGHPPNCVNLLEASSADHLLVVRHLDRVGVLASVLSELRGADFNVKEMQNTVFQGEHAAVARIGVSGDPSALLPKLQALEHVLHVGCVRVQRGGRA